MSAATWRNRHLLWLSVIILIIGGLSALLGLPRQEDPRLTNRFPMVITTWPGASAERMEALVTRPLEEAVRTIAEVAVIQADSRPGVSSISIELGDDVTDVDKVNSRLRDRVSGVPLPAGATAEFDDERGAVAYSLIVALTWRGEGEPPMDLLGRLGETLAERLRHLSGSERVDTFGGPSEEIRVTLDDQRLADLGLDLPQVATLLRQADSKRAAGVVTSGDRRLPLELTGAFDASARVAAVPLQVADGRAMTVGDIATVERGWQEPLDTAAYHDGNRAILIAARLERGVQLDDWAKPAEAAIAAFSADQGQLIGVETVFDQRRYTNRRLSGLLDNLLVGALVIVGVVVVLMGPRAAIVVGLALPLTVGGLLMILALLGVPLHQMSLFGIIIALGLLIDNAIVMVDEVRKRMRAGASALTAITNAVSHLRGPLASSTFTTVLSFMPIALMPGPAGEFVGTIAVAVIAALTTSLLIALFILPSLTALIARPNGRGDTWRDGVQWRGAQAVAQRVVTAATRHPGAAVLLVFALATVGFVRARELGNQFFPAADRDMFQVRVWMPPGTALDGTGAAVAAIDAIVAEQAGVQHRTWHLGGSIPSMYYNQVMDVDGNRGFAQGVIAADDLATAGRLINDLQRELDQALPHAQVVVSPFAQGPPVPAPVMFRLVGPDGDRLRELGDDVRAILAQVPGVTHTQAGMESGQPKLWLNVDEAEASERGWTRRQLATRLQARVDGQHAGSQLEATEDIPVRVVLADDRIDQPDDLLDSWFAVDGAILPLGAISDLTLEPELASVFRRNGQRTNVISAYVVADALPPDVTQATLTALTEAGWAPPPGYRLEVGGDSEESSKATGNLATFAPVLGLLMLTSLILAFRSVVIAGIIGLVAITSVGFGLLALRISGYAFGFNPILGIAGLVGLAINDSIVVLAAIREDAKARAGDPVAITRAALGCGRHVLATTFTTIGGFLPLLLSGGAFWPPLAVVIAGGVAGATLLALVLVPSAYALVARWGWLGKPQHTDPDATPVHQVATLPATMQPS